MASEYLRNSASGVRRKRPDRERTLCGPNPLDVDESKHGRHIQTVNTILHSSSTKLLGLPLFIIDSLFPWL